MYKTQRPMFSDHAKSFLKDKYLLKDEDVNGLIRRVAKAYSSDKEHESRLIYYMENHWFLPATPILANAGTKRGLPISCFVNEPEDNLDSISDLFKENMQLSAGGGGIGSYWGNLRSIGAGLSENRHTSGIIPFIKVQDSLTLAVSQGGIRRGSSAVYLDVYHPEIFSFLDIRKPLGRRHKS